MVLLAGKGHETTQEIGNRTLPFDEAAIAGAALDRRRAGSPMS
jgi:UDP-N-acetylmuramoyl-L-alanyl-D-glutamate--2,6-diaminopimelate ligase